ncbi:hypothetical protein [Sphingopyxis sp. Geo48]|uniref:hypothetical protein n=1 Tax=Sphingopyxis sp. Geo48 TaxID=545241 RepID=UPI0024B68E4D|nr:hypothetical protein [Sphingopyxis sp. Geo48]
MSDILIGVTIVSLYIALLLWIVWRVESMLKGKLGDETAAHKRVTDALAAKSARIQTLIDIARNQKSVKSGRIIDVLEG